MSKRNGLKADVAKSEPALTVDEMIAALQAIKRDGHGAWPVYFQQMDGAIPHAVSFRVTEGDPADGTLVWLYRVGAFLPEWMHDHG